MDKLLIEFRLESIVANLWIQVWSNGGIVLTISHKDESIHSQGIILNLDQTQELFAKIDEALASIHYTIR